MVFSAERSELWEAFLIITPLIIYMIHIILHALNFIHALLKTVLLEYFVFSSLKVYYVIGVVMTALLEHINLFKKNV